VPTQYQCYIRRACTTVRIGWTVASLIVVQGTAVGLSVLPVAWLLRELFERTSAAPIARLVLSSFVALPAYVLFTLILLFLSPLGSRLAGWRTLDGVELRIADFDWPLLNWARYNAGIQLTRSLAGWLFRATPIWSAHLRLSGARIGRRVFINSLHLSDYNLLEFGDDVVIGGEVHLSGHTVEAGVLKTGGVRLGRGVTIGLGSVIDIDVSVPAGCQIGAMSLVPKHTHLRVPTVYAGVPVRQIA
jgi:acetyltransferase-like isoleucine patch superfamily enzyme